MLARADGYTDRLPSLLKQGGALSAEEQCVQLTECRGMLLEGLST